MNVEKTRIFKLCRFTLHDDRSVIEYWERKKYQVYNIHFRDYILSGNGLLIEKKVSIEGKSIFNYFLSTIKWCAAVGRKRKTKK